MTICPELLDVLGQPKINFSGGEPLLSPVIFDLLQICVERGAYPGFVTNGRLLKFVGTGPESVGTGPESVGTDPESAGTGLERALCG